jgi:hypothetical protein
MKFSWNWVAAIALLVVGIVATVAVAAPSGGGNGGTDDNGNERRGLKFEIRGDPDQHFSKLADELWVSTDALENALESVHEDLGPPPRPFRKPPTKAQMEKRCNEMTDALAKKLDKSGEEVRSALKSVMKQEIEDAVDADRLTRAQADRILKRLDQADCLPALKFGLHGRGIDCAGRPGGPNGESVGPDRRGGSFMPGPVPDLPPSA